MKLPHKYASMMKQDKRKDRNVHIVDLKKV